MKEKRSAEQIAQEINKACNMLNTLIHEGLKTQELFMLIHKETGEGKILLNRHPEIPTDHIRISVTKKIKE